MPRDLRYALSDDGDLFITPEKSFAAAKPVFMGLLIHDEPLKHSLEMRKTFDSPLVNHFSQVLS